MYTRELPKSEWKTYFDDYCIEPLVKNVDIEILSPSHGDVIGEQNGKLNGLSYDPKDDQFYVFTDHLRHAISHPKKVYIIEDGITLKSIAIEDRDNNKQIIHLKDPDLAKM